MRKLSSKRQRKQKNKVSLATKQFQRPRGIGDELDAAEEPVPFDSNAIILPAHGSATQALDLGEEEEQPKHLSKSQKRKARKVQEEKVRKSQREGVLESLAQTALSKETLHALRPLAARGQKETKKQAAARRESLRAAGVDVESDEEAEPSTAPWRKDYAAEGSGGSSSDSDSDSDTDGPVRVPATTRPAPMRWDEPGVNFSEPAAKRVRPSEEDEARPALSAGEAREALLRAKAELGLDAVVEDTEDAPVRLRPSVPLENLPTPRSVPVQRRPEIESGLPILGMEQEVMELLAEHDVLVLSGETGCGKTTQVPQFLYESGYGCSRFPERAGTVGITQPRRIGAISTAERVADELDTPVGEVVGYQVRYDRALGDNTALKFMTDGILLRELQHDFLLPHYSAILVDEAHERSLNTDILLGLLSRVVTLRRQMHSKGQSSPSGDPVWPLKLIIMSATLRVEDFIQNTRLFPHPPPLITVPARQYPVTVHFSRRTEMTDYVGSAHRKVSQIHRQLPPGGILVFLTGQGEVRQLCRQLEATFKSRGRRETPAHASAGAEDPVEGAFGGDVAEREDLAAEARAALDGEREDVDDFDDQEDDEEEEDVEVMGGAGFTPEQIAAAEAEFEKRLGIALPTATPSGKTPSGPSPVHVLPLYAMLSAAAQAEVFRKPPEGHRLVVVATNVAETSLTIPGIRYVVDAGRAKQRVLESSASGMARYEVGWVSQASAAQRAGRAGRTGPGHCYRLFSSAVFNDKFAKHAAPEILGAPQESVVLALKSMGVAKVHNFPFPTPPEAAALRSAISVLTMLGALQPGSEALTDLGRAMAALPINPRHACMLMHAAHEEAGAPAGLLNAAVALAAALSVESPFLALAPPVPAAEAASVPAAAAAAAETRRKAQASLRDRDSDGLSALRALCAYLSHGRDAGWAGNAGLHVRHLEEGLALRSQLARVLCQGGGGVLGKAEAALETEGTAPLAAPGSRVSAALRRAMLAGWPDRVARRQRSAEYLAGQTKQGYSSRAVRYQAAELVEPVFLHPQSALHATPPAFLLYTDLVRTSKRPYVSGVTAIDVAWLPGTAATLCTLSAPLPSPPPFYSPAKDAVLAWHDVEFGRHGWALPRTTAPLSSAPERCVRFAAALLEGKALPALTPLVPGLAAPPSALARPEARAQARASNLLLALERAGVDSRAALAVSWKRDPAFLRRELEAWYRPEYAASLAAAWPSLAVEARHEN